jgi:SAM-dependent methyltransferase
MSPEASSKGPAGALLFLHLAKLRKSESAMSTPSPSVLRRYYDAAPYYSYAYPESAPEHLAAVAHVFGLPSPAAATARVLELGCASGGNLIPYALRNPASRSIGIDLSTGQIRLGRNLVDRLALRNIELIAADFSRLDSKALGKFDYIVCHGLYSWIPAHMQDQLLSLCKDVLADDGLVYISYNTYPGWKSKEVVRDAMLLHCRNKADPGERVAYAKAMLGFLRKLASKEGTLAHILEESIDIINRTGDDYLLHDYLEPFNEPCYFEEFVSSAKEAGLAYLAESGLRPMRPENYGRDVAEPLLGTFGEDQVTMEQYLDFVTNRSFRQTLLVHSSRSNLIDHRLKRDRLGDLHFSANLPCLSGATRADGSLQEYGRAGGSIFATSHTTTKRMADALTTAWPNTLTRGELIEAGVLPHVEPADPANPVAAETVVDESLIHFISNGMCRIRRHRIVQLGPLHPHPRIDPLVQSMILALGDAGGSVTNTWHDNIDLSSEERTAYLLMDGTRDASEITRTLVDHTAHGNADRNVQGQIDAMIEKARLGGLFSSAATSWKAYPR